MFYRLLTRLAAQILLGLSAFVWGAIAALDAGRGSLRIGFALAAVLAVVSFVGINRGQRWSSVLGAIALFAPIGLLAHDNGASPWAWLFWLFCAAATERWLRDALDERKESASDAGQDPAARD